MKPSSAPGNDPDISGTVPLVTSGSAVADTDSFVAVVGQRVGKARQRRGITRKKLSELSGVSLRYLASLETGAGNISVALLHKIALALGHRVEWFVCEDDPWHSDAVQLAEWFRQASPAVQQQVVKALKPKYETGFKKKRICLIGLRGAGKSTLGKNVSAALELPFIELNTEIAALAGMPINELISFFGQEGYRRLEHQALERIVDNNEKVILAAAGGVVAEPETYLYLQKHFHTVWLKASPEEHMSRVRAQGDERPMTGNPKAMEQLKSILTSREALYSSADFSVNTSGKSVQQSEMDVLGVVRGVL